jgi:hypothetical protein
VTRIANMSAVQFELAVIVLVAFYRDPHSNSLGPVCTWMCDTSDYKPFSFFLITGMLMWGFAVSGPGYKSNCHQVVPRCR